MYSELCSPYQYIAATDSYPNFDGYLEYSKRRGHHSESPYTSVFWFLMQIDQIRKSFDFRPIQIVFDVAKNYLQRQLALKSKFLPIYHGYWLLWNEWVSIGTYAEQGIVIAYRIIHVKFSAGFCEFHDGFPIIRFSPKKSQIACLPSRMNI